MAGGILAAVPPVQLALVFQRYIVSGILPGQLRDRIKPLVNPV